MKSLIGPYIFCVLLQPLQSHKTALERSYAHIFVAIVITNQTDIPCNVCEVLLQKYALLCILKTNATSGMRATERKLYMVPGFMISPKEGMAR